MNHRLSLFAPSTLSSHAAAAAIHRRDACEFSHHTPADFTTPSFSSGAGKVSNIPASTSYQLNKVLRLAPSEGDTGTRPIRRQDTKRRASDAAATRQSGDNNLSQASLSRTFVVRSFSNQEVLPVLQS
jgi:hypothetical protein